MKVMTRVVRREPRYFAPTRWWFLPLVVALFGGALVAPAALAGTTPASSPATAEGPSKVIERFDSALIETMKAGKKAGIAGRVRVMQSVVQTSFDVPGISQMVLGHYWNTLSQGQQKRFVNLLSRLVVVSYAANFDSYSGQQLKIMNVRRQGKRAFVSTQFSDPGSGQSHTFDYIVHLGHAGNWTIINVIADGVSDVAVKRAEYTSIMGKGSFQDLINALQKQIKHAEKKG